MRLLIKARLSLWWFSLALAYCNYIYAATSDIEASNQNIQEAEALERSNLRGSSPKVTTDGGNNDVVEVQARMLQQGNCVSMTTGVFYNIIGRQSRKALSVAGASNADGANIEIRDVGTGGNFNWKLEATVTGYYHVIAQHSGKGLNVERRSTANGANVIQWPITDNSNDEWCFKSTGDGYYSIEARHSGLFLDVAGQQVNNGANVHQWIFADQPNQQWQLIQKQDVQQGKCATIPPGIYFNIVGRQSGKGLNVVGASNADGANVEIRELADGLSNNWRLEPTATGYYHVIAQHSGKGLNVERRSTTNGANVIQWPITDNSNDDWCFKSAGDGYYFIEARHSGLFLDVAGQQVNNGANVHQWTFADQPNQQWKLIPLKSSTNSFWEGPYDLPLVPAASANLPDGRILLWSAYTKFNFGGRNGQTWTSTFDPKTKTSTSALIKGTAVLPNGEVLITGGSNSEVTTRYDPGSNSWVGEQRMNIPRGYHSMTVLDDGSVFTLGGSWSGGTGGKTGEVWSFDSKRWSVKTGIPCEGSLLTRLADQQNDYHMWLFTAPSGKVFHAGPSTRMHWIDTKSAQGSVVESVNRADDTDAMVGSAVMYDTGKILTVGGTLNYQDGLGSNRAYVIDVNQNAVSVQRTGDMAYKRAFCNGVVLPSGEVVVIGGAMVALPFKDLDAVFAAEIWNPNTGQFKEIASMKIPRTYHATVLLLQDGRILAAGGGLCGNDCAANHANSEILTPPYLVNDNGSLKTRPIISSAPNSASPGATMTVTMNTRQSHTFSLVRTGANTHNINNDMRRIALPVASKSGRNFRVAIPSNPAIALPGNYFLFAMNSQGVPSIASTITVNRVASIGRSSVSFADALDDGANGIAQDDSMFSSSRSNCSNLEMTSYHIIAKHSGMGLAFEGNSAKSPTMGTAAVQINGTDTIWRLDQSIKDHGGFYHIFAEEADIALNVFGASQEEGSKIITWPVTEVGTYGDWCFQYHEDGYYTIVAKHSNQVISVVNESFASGAGVVQMPDIGGAHQQWLLKVA